MAEDPYDFWYNKNLPFFKVESWENLKIINQILSLGENVLQKFSE